MKKMLKNIVINNPEPPKDDWYYVRVAAIVLLLIVQGFLLYSAFSSSQKIVKNVIMESTLPTSTEIENPLPKVLSENDEEMLKKLDAFFGPLPQRKINASPAKTLFPVRGIYIGDASRLDENLESIKGTEVNAVVIDCKENWGLSYASKVPLAQEMQASGNLDLKAIFDKCHQAGLHVIARIVCFKDDVMSVKRPDLCISDKDGHTLTYPLEGETVFVNAYLPETWDYLIDIAKEVHGLGADEIQFDYVRFPTGSPADGKIPHYSDKEEIPAKEYAINRFLETARIELQENLGIPVTADLFSVVMSSPIDGELIGQNWKTIGRTGIDAICPMIYPSHYANSSYGSMGNGEGSFIGREFFEIPDKFPYEVVKNAFIDGSKAAKHSQYSRLRPWLQAFSAEYLAPGYWIPYGAEEIREQIRATYESGYMEWLLWNAEYKYPKEYFLSQENSDKEMEALVEASIKESEAQAAIEAEGTRRFPIVPDPKP